MNITDIAASPAAAAVAGPEVIAAVVEQIGGEFSRDTIELDVLRPDEVRVRIHASGICATDLAVQAGKTPFPLPGILGHEGAGVIEEVGAAVNALAPGDRVVMTFDSCGQCEPCLAARPVQCVNWFALNMGSGTRLDGSLTTRRCTGRALHGHFFGQSSFATHAICSQRSVVKVETDTDFAVLAPLGCSGQTGAGSVWNLLRPEPGSSVIIYGGGAVGLMAVLAAQLTPARQVIVVDRVESRLDLARELGATVTVNAGTDDVATAVNDATEGRGADRALETTGNMTVLRQAVDLLAVSGVCVVVGAPPTGSEVAFDVQEMLVRHPTIIGVSQGLARPRQIIPALVELHEAGRFPAEKLITAFPFDQINEAVTAAKQGEVIKPVLTMR
ncbi:aryl-alcohol dehydrogenase [Mycobacterium frederiksbergense]|uniref:Aryl-alcohol dehydrogenase n=1 Tax=Mycolicibacterium frederiksbergense TaxID=117567 RepID=A0ABT6KXY6_9MYCO|nr:NAD(P)-dependent alcohol dehydrogenase [Mycolicibacterium frederiksbergense]MDH6195577.1 aryl-alcohol dehydrogenase [Mycolicibacterium frederiksbergense]